jgi:hypothetical protein
VTLGDWVRDDLPDLLWPVLVLAEQGPDGLRKVCDWQTRVIGVLRPDYNFTDGTRLDGRLTRIAACGKGSLARSDLLRTEAVDLGLLSREVSSALALYPTRPAPEFLGPEADGDEDKSFRLITMGIFAALTDGHLEALIKFLAVTAQVLDDSLRTSPETVELLRHYPGDRSTRDQADSVIRAMFGATKGGLAMSDPDVWEQSSAWAKEFWNFNGRTTRCFLASDIEALRGENQFADAGGSVDAVDAHVGPQIDESALAVMSLDDERRQAVELANEVGRLFTLYVSALEVATPLDLFSPAKNEVHGGLVTRASQWVVSALRSPHTWNGDQGSQVTRLLAETFIYLTWMDQDPQRYVAYQEYGTGRAKLSAAHLDNLLAEMPQAPAFITEGAERLRQHGGSHEAIDTTVVSVESTFAGISLRLMAEQVQLMELYNLVYQPTSGVLHGEWWSVQENSTERCMNLLHMGHRVPSYEGVPAPTDRVGRYWVHELRALMVLSLEQQGVEGDVESFLDTDISGPASD